MANVRISELPAATLPLTGAELVPVVQGGVTKQTTAASVGTNVVNVKAYGAVGDGVADDTAAIRAAVAAANSATMAGNSGLYGPGTVGSGTAPVVYFPRGVYKVTDYITNDVASTVNYKVFVGDNAIIAPSAGVTVFGGIAYNVRFQGLTFRGGACAISVKTANADTSYIYINNCEFQSQTVAAIKSDNNSSSTVINVNQSKFYMSQTAGGYIGYFESGDKIIFCNCWMTNKSATAFYNGGTFAVLQIRDCIGVPGGDMSLSTGQWVVNYGSVHLENFRMGGESGGATFVSNYADIDVTAPIDPRFVIIRDCPAYAQHYAIRFYKLPNQFEFTGNNGLVDNDGLYFDSAIAQTDFANFQRFGILNIDPSYSYLFFVGQYAAQKDRGLAVFATKLIRNGQITVSSVDRIPIANVYGSGAYSANINVDSANVTLSSVTDRYGATFRQAVATADGAYVEWFRTTYLNPAVLPANKIYTLVLVIEGVDTIRPNIRMVVRIGGATFDGQVSKGRNVFAIPFVYLNDSGSAVTAQDELRIQFYGMRNGDTIQLGRHLLLDGLVNWRSEVLQLVSDATPTNYTNAIGAANQGYFRGDLVWYSDVAASDFIGEVCTTAGTPGTWKTWGAVSA